MPFLFSSSTLALSFPPSFLLPQSLWQIWQELFSVSFFTIRLQWITGYSFLPENDTADELARRIAIFVSSAVPCILSLISTLVFSQTEGVLFYLNSFDTQASSVFTEELMLPRHARCALSCLRYNGHSLLLSSYLTRIGGIENSSRSACGHLFQDTSHLILHSPATYSLRRLLFVALYSLLIQALESCPASGAPWSSAMLPCLGGGRSGNNSSLLGFVGILQPVDRNLAKNLHLFSQLISNAVGWYYCYTFCPQSIVGQRDRHVFFSGLHCLR